MKQQNLDSNAKHGMEDFVDKLFTSSVSHENYEELVYVENTIFKKCINDNKIDLERYVHSVVTGSVSCHSSEM